MASRRFGRTVLMLTVVAMVAVAAPAVAEEDDPWQSLNRRTFAFNEWLDRNLLIPVANAWDFVAPDAVQTGIQNIFDTADMVVVFGNDVLQLKPVAAGQDLARLVVNATVGIGGIFDVATQVGIPQNDEDFGQTLGYWGVPAGPYLVLPIFGPSNPRDAFGFAVDTMSNPWTYYVDWYVSVSIAVFKFVNLRTIYLEDVEDLRAAAIDYYVFQRNAYVQNRELVVYDRESVDEDLYYFEDE
jgi:phospholipid-binding lipoprotein MlaA